MCATAAAAVSSDNDDDCRLSSGMNGAAMSLESASSSSASRLSEGGSVRWSGPMEEMASPARVRTCLSVVAEERNQRIASSWVNWELGIG